jgi:hypothetical protein
MSPPTAQLALALPAADLCRYGRMTPWRAEKLATRLGRQASDLSLDGWALYGYVHDQSRFRNSRRPIALPWQRACRDLGICRTRFFLAKRELLWARAVWVTFRRSTLPPAPGRRPSRRGICYIGHVARLRLRWRGPPEHQQPTARAEKTRSTTTSFKADLSFLAFSASRWLAGPCTPEASIALDELHAAWGAGP